MRLWSIHPKYLDVKGLCGLWREGIIARNALLGIKKGYRNHPQLERFKKQKEPVVAMDTYLISIYEESKRRNYNFHRDRIGNKFQDDKIDVTEGQINYEVKHLKRKLIKRDLKKYEELKKAEEPQLNPIFRAVKGEIESWERPF